MRQRLYTERENLFGPKPNDDDTRRENSTRRRVQLEPRLTMKALLSLPISSMHLRSFGFPLASTCQGSLRSTGRRMELRFTSKEGTLTILAKLQVISNKLNMSLDMKDKRVVKIEGVTEGRKGVLSIDAGIFEMAPGLHMVELKKANGDTLEYHDALRQDIRPALKDIVWAWQGEQQPQPEPQPCKSSSIQKESCTISIIQNQKE